MTEAPYIEAGAPLPYCKGCGHGIVLRALGEALAALRLPPDDVAIVTDIGCVGLADVLFTTPHTVHTTHGRSTAFAAGLALADSVLGGGRLKPVVLIGDGGATIGINHLIGAALLNPDVTIVVHNNFLYGMTGGQNSAFSPLGFVTATTRDGNFVPPLDLGRVLLASRAAFVARTATGASDLAATLARAIAHPGFAVVEILELCTAYGTRWNAITGARLKELAAAAGYEMGVLRDEARPTFGAAYRARAAAGSERNSAQGRAAGAGAALGSESPARPAAARAHRLSRQAGIVLAGTAGERVQTAASLLGRAAIASGLSATQKNDNPVTQGTGFSVSEVVLSPEPILFTGLERPDAVLVVSQEGAAELSRSGVLDRIAPETLLLADVEVALPPLAASPRRLPFRKAAGGKSAALAAAAAWVAASGAFPIEALFDAVAARQGAEARETVEAIGRLAEDAAREIVR